MVRGLAQEERSTYVCAPGEQHPWEILDFGELEGSLAARITDHHLKSVLGCINANAKLKRLKLSGCVNITGSGLTPLRRSTTIEQLDLSLVGEHQHPVLDPKPRLALECVVPILETLICNDDASISHLQYPQSWLEAGQKAEKPPDLSADDPMFKFLTLCTYMNIRQNNIRCCECTDVVTWYGRRGCFAGKKFAVQDRTCYNCLASFCEDCEDPEADDYLQDIVQHCGLCDRVYCRECASMEKSDCCNTEYCKECMPLEDCVGCESRLCRRCIPQLPACSRCSVSFCKLCAGIYFCGKCNVGLCDDCFESEDAPLCDCEEFEEI